MSKRGKHIVFYTLLGIVFLSIAVPATSKDTATTQQKISLPPTFANQLDSLKDADQLERWLNVWYVHLSDNPAVHYKELTIPLKTMWRKPKTKAEKVAWFYLQILVGYYELQQGNILTSTHVYEQAYQFVQKMNAVRKAEILEYLIKPLGNNYTRLGDYERAFYIQKEGLKLAKQLGNSMQEAAMLANISTTSRWNDHLLKALNFTERGLQIVDTHSPLQGLLYSTQADILQDMDRLEKAELIIEKGLKLFAKIPLKENSNNAYWYAGTLVTAGEIAQKKQRYEAAIDHYQKALQIFSHYFPQSRQREKLKIQVSLGEINLSEGFYQKGLQHFNKALNGLLPTFNEKDIWPVDSVLYAENTLLDALKGKAKSLKMLKKDRLALTGYQKTATVVKQLRKIIFSREAKRLLQQQSLQTTEDAIALAFRLYKKTGDIHFAELAFKAAEQQKARLLLNDLQKDISYTKDHRKDSLFLQQKRLKQAVAYYTHAYIKATLQHKSKDSARWKHKIDQTEYRLSILHQKINPNLNWESSINLKKLYAGLPKNTTVWEYFTGPQQWYAFAIDQSGIVQFTYLGKAQPLKKATVHFVNDWFANGPNAMINHPKAYFQASFTLYNKLCAKLPNQHEKLLLIPDGVLGKLPFDALITDTVYRPDPGSWSYLLKKSVSSQTYSLSVWYQLQKNFSRSYHQKGFSGFFIDPSKNSNLATLKGVKKEQKSIENHLKGHYYINNKATAVHLFHAIKNDEVVHISTHSFLMGKKQIPALQMSDQKIVLADLYPLNVHPSLVVISACQTADGLLSPGEGIISLARQFTAVGAGGVIAALWSINDETAAALTAIYYKKLQQSSNKSGALYQAKVAWLNQHPHNAALKLPYYWAGLVYYGNNVPLSSPLKQPAQFPFLGWSLIVLLFIALILSFSGKGYGKAVKR